MTAPRDTFGYLDGILDAVEKIEIFTRGMSYEEFFGDDKTVYAVTRALEVIGEATKCIPREIRENYPGYPWTGMTGMRDKLIHAYFGINRRSSGGQSGKISLPSDPRYRSSGMTWPRMGPQTASAGKHGWCRGAFVPQNR